MTSLKVVIFFSVAFVVLAAGVVDGNVTSSATAIDNETETGTTDSTTFLDLEDSLSNVTDEANATSALELEANATTVTSPSVTPISLNNETGPSESSATIKTKDIVTTMQVPDVTFTSTSSPTTATTDGPSSTAMATESSGKWTWFVLTLDGNCSVISRGRQAQGEKSFKNQLYLTMMQWLDIASRTELVINDTKCKNDKIHVNFSVYVGLETNLSSRLMDMENMDQPLLRVHDTDLYVYQIQLWDGGFLNKEPEIPFNLRHTDVELVVYIAVGSSCAFLVILAAVLLLCKYCCFRSSEPKSFAPAHAMAGVTNVNDGVNNCNMRLEDYTLTRIPRPKFGYVDYYRGVSKRYSPLDDKVVTSSSAGMVQPFDTSVVPLEDVYGGRRMEAMRDFKDGVIVRPSDVRRFSGSLSRMYNGRAGFDDYSARSNEYLHKSKRDYEQGVDNPNFR